MNPEKKHQEAIDLNLGQLFSKLDGNVHYLALEAVFADKKLMSRIKQLAFENPDFSNFEDSLLLLLSYLKSDVPLRTDDTYMQYRLPVDVYNAIALHISDAEANYVNEK
jgi:hypothetical protein